MKPISSLLKKVSKLIENYKINKQTVQNHAHTDLVLSFKNVMKKLGLHKEYDIKGKNIYTVRTKKLYDYCIHTLNIPHVNTTAFSEISADNTNKLIEYLKVEKIPANDLKKDIITVLYFDTENINAADSIAVDGTINGLDKIEIVKDANAVLYSDNNRSTTSS